MQTVAPSLGSLPSPLSVTRSTYIYVLYCIIVDVEMLKDRKTEICKDVSMMVMRNDIVIIEHDRRRPGLPNAQ